MQGIYLHGFASSPNSAKARYLCDRWPGRLQAPDLNTGGFQTLTLTRQLQQVAAVLPARGTVTIVGSSFGGLTATWLAQQHERIDRLVLLAPAFGFLGQLPRLLSDEAVARWKTEGILPVYHHQAEKPLPLNYQFLEDLRSYDDAQLQRELPTLILHGKRDETIPIASSRAYAAPRPWVTLVELNSDHALADVLPEIWEATRGFLALED